MVDAQIIPASDSFQLIIRAREAVIYEGRITYLSSVNDKGKFDVLPEHTNFISLVKDKIVFKEEHGQEREIPVKQALLRVIDDEAKVFLGIGE